MKKYSVKVNNRWVNTFSYDDVDGLWQAISEDSEYLGLAVTGENLLDWGYCGGDNIEDFLENIMKTGFIDNFDIEEKVED